MNKKQNTQHENIIAAYAAIPHDHGLRATVAIYDLVTAVMNCSVPSIALARYARDETEKLADERNALRAQNAELVTALRSVVTLADGQGRLNLPMVAGEARALLARIDKA